MNAVFADTSYYFAILNPRDQYHAAATQISLQLSQRVVTSEFVLVELGNAMTSPQSRDTYVRMVGHLRSSEQMTIIPATGRLFGDGLQLFAARKDKSWSMTDCISLAIMRNEGLTEALTADHHFEQAGFRILLK